MQEWCQENQSPSGIEYGKGCEWQQEGLLQVYEQQKGDWGNMAS